MSRDDAPNLRGIDPDRTCETCYWSVWVFAPSHPFDNEILKCGKYDFVILDGRCLICDDWEG